MEHVKSDTINVPPASTPPPPWFPALTATKTAGTDIYLLVVERTYIYGQCFVDDLVRGACSALLWYYSSYHMWSVSVPELELRTSTLYRPSSPVMYHVCTLLKRLARRSNNVKLQDNTTRRFQCFGECKTEVKLTPVHTRTRTAAGVR